MKKHKIKMAKSECLFLLVYQFLSPNFVAQSGVIILNENKDSSFLKKIEQHEITKRQNKRETRLKQRKIFKKGKT